MFVRFVIYNIYDRLTILTVYNLLISHIALGYKTNQSNMLYLSINTFNYMNYFHVFIYKLKHQILCLRILIKLYF